MRGRGTRSLWLLPVFVAAATPATAQRVTRTPVDTVPRVGERVQLRSRLLDARGRPVDCEGRITAIAGDTLVVESREAWHACPRQVFAADAVDALRVRRGDRGSRLGHAALGLAIGAGAGALLGYASGSNSSGGGEDESLITAVLTIAGATTAGAIGVIVGAVLPAGARWTTVPHAQPVRVGVSFPVRRQDAAGPATPSARGRSGGM